MMVRISKIINLIKHPFTEWEVTKAKRKYRKGSPVCECCGTKSSFFGRNNDVHHMVPVHVDPKLACDQDNLITLDRHCHFLIGHLGNWRSWNRRLDQSIVEFIELYIQMKSRNDSNL